MSLIVRCGCCGLADVYAANLLEAEGEDRERRLSGRVQTAVRCAGQAVTAGNRGFKRVGREFIRVSSGANVP